MISRPLLRRRIDAGRVVAAGVQHDDRAVRAAARSAREHAVEVEAARRRVVVRVAVDREAGALEQRAVVLPAGIADPDLRAGREPAQEIGADLEAAGAAQRLHA